MRSEEILRSYPYLEHEDDRDLFRQRRDTSSLRAARAKVGRSPSSRSCRGRSLEVHRPRDVIARRDLKFFDTADVLRSSQQRQMDDIGDHLLCRPFSSALYPGSAATSASSPAYRHPGCMCARERSGPSETTIRDLVRFTLLVIGDPFAYGLAGVEMP